MSDIKLPVERREPSGYALVVYILLLAGFFNVLTWIVGLVMAYLGRGEAPAWQQSHMTFQIRTFWIGLLFSVISGVLVFAFGIGLLLGALTTLWFIVRCVRGILWLQKGEPVPDPESWAFGDRKR